MSKEGFLIYTGLYSSIREFLTLEQKGMLLDAIHDYQESGIEPSKQSPIAMPFAIYKNQFRLDSAKHEKRAEKARQNGQKGGRPKKSEENPENPVGFSETQQNPEKPNESYKEKEKEKVKDKDKEKDSLSENVSVSSDPKSFDCTKAAREFESMYKKAGRRNAIEREYAQALIKIKAQYGYEFEAGHEAIKKSAAAYMTFAVMAGTEFRYMPNPETWLAERMYETNWNVKAKELRSENTTNEPKPKPLIGLSKVEELDRQREERHRRQAEEAEAERKRKEEEEEEADDDGN